MVDVDARKSLRVLKDEWKDCTACALGQHRQASGGEYVFGEGVSRAIMFIGEGPGVEEEQAGRPFIGTSGLILRDILNKLSVTEFYITNIVSCRSCEPNIDPETGLQRVRRNKLLFKDTPPLPDQMAACRARLLQEIYIVDPIVIVTLGAISSEAILDRHVTITKERGRLEEIEIPGAMYEPVLTEKRRVWGRKIDGRMQWPIRQSTVRYPVVPTIHPAYVARKAGDRGPRSEYAYFVRDIRFAVGIYERYLVDALGVEPRIEPNAEESEEQ